MTDLIGDISPAEPNFDPTSLASFTSRLLATVVDCLVLLVPGAFLRFGIDAPAWVLVLLGGAYFIGLEGGASGQTVGKRALSIRVADATSKGPIDFGRAAIRYGARSWSGLILIGYLWPLWDPQRQTWHDKIAETFVIRVERLSSPTTSF